MIHIPTGLTAWVLALLATTVAAPSFQVQAAEARTSKEQSLEDFHLDELPHYKSQQLVSGTIRNFGFGLNGVLVLWEEGFRKIHPGVRFEDHLPSSEAAFPALVTGVTDLAPDGG